MAAADKINMDGTATLIVAWRGGRHAFARVLKAGGDVIEVLTGYAATTAQMINDGQGRIYDPGDEQDEERDYLSANREELLDTALLAQIELQNGRSGATILYTLGDDRIHDRVLGRPLHAIGRPCSGNGASASPAKDCGANIAGGGDGVIHCES